jgi:hypothetical protein
VDYQVRAARATDVDRIVALCDDAGTGVRSAGPLNAADLLRQLAYLPQASVLIAEAHREIVGGAVLALRPSVSAGGYVGTVDLLVVDPNEEIGPVSDVLIEELLRSARNKGCCIVEAPFPADPVARDIWERHGFAGAEPRLERTVETARAGVRQAR